MIYFLFRLSNVYWRLKGRLYYRTQFGALGPRSIIRKPMLLLGTKGLFIGSGCGIRDGARIEVLQGRNPPGRIDIGNDTSIEQNVHIVCGGHVKIGDRVTIAPGCVIVDANHPYEDVSSDKSIGRLLTEEPSFVEIGDECFLGAGCTVLPGVKLGKHCVVGANAVVTKSMPPYTVCVGIPAKAIRRFDQETQSWTSVSS